MENEKKSISNPIKRLLGINRLSLGKINNKQTIVPGKPTVDPETNKVSYKDIKPINFPSDIQQAYNYFLQNFSYYQGNSPNNQRFQLYKDLLFMFKNCGIMARAQKIYVDEIISGKGMGERIIEIKGKDKKIEKYFYNWLDKIGLDGKKIYQLAENIVTYGDAFYVHAIDLQAGIVGLTVIDPFLVKDVICFNLSNLGTVTDWFSNNRNDFNRYQSLQQILDTIMSDPEQMEAISTFYQSYTLGYQLKFSAKEEDDKSRAVPPWMIGHCGEGTTSSEFFPFSSPTFINSISLYKSYMTSQMLQDMLRVASFPKEKVTIKGGDTLTPIDRMARLEETREFIENISPASNTKDDPGVGSRLYAMEELFDIDIMSPEVNLDSVGDLELKLDDLILSTAIPDSYLIPSRGSGMGGENASALYFNNKIFQRSVESKKLALLAGIENSFRTHLAITGDFEGEATEFELSMPVSNSFYTSDKISQDKETMDFALEMINSLGQAIGLERGDQIPPEIIKDILLSYLPIEPGKLNSWINALVKVEDEKEDEPLPQGIPPAQGQGGASPLIIPMDTGEGAKPASEGGAPP